tara:strand:- start:351 stop:1025 length:675 start_codon:yes stop_codon:yes gene_type:complete
MKNKVKRFERKWLFKSSDHLTLINSLTRSKLFFRNQYPLRNVNSIYFDSHDYISIRQNLDGVSNKKKIRIRWYGEKDVLTKPIIEIKSKKGFETKKESIPIKDLDNLKLFSIENLKIIQDKLNLKLKQKKIIYPVLTTHYEREYFISSNGKIRATVDYNLKSIFLSNLSQIDIIKNFKNICILELKYSTGLDKYVRENLKDISLRLSKNSKFVNSAFEKPKFFS